jgi:hypothetical protein
MRAGLFGALAAIVVTLPSSALAVDGRCQQLEALHAQYAGVELTPSQKVLKKQLTAWYVGHCRGRTINTASE